MTPWRRGEPAGLCIWEVRCGGLTAAMSKNRDSDTPANVNRQHYG